MKVVTTGSLLNALSKKQNNRKVMIGFSPFYYFEIKPFYH
jgi:hypothetical protein